MHFHRLAEQRKRISKTLRKEIVVFEKAKYQQVYYDIGNDDASNTTSDYSFVGRTSCPVDK
jgi:hypothetical protein